MNMMTFQEFLRKQASKGETREKRERREEWVAAVKRLMDQLRAWLKESDPDQVLDVIPMEIERVEAGLGRYLVPGLVIRTGNSRVQVLPIGRSVVADLVASNERPLNAEGRVDITDGVQRWMLYHTSHDGQETWYALDQRLRAAPLDQTRFEAILVDLLS
jgi:hypothetical protein